MYKSVKVITVVFSFILGILSFFFPWFYLIGLSYILLCAYFSLSKKAISYLHLSIIILALIVGIFNTKIHFHYDDDLTPYTNNNNVTLEAEILSIPTNNIKDKTKFYAKVTSVSLENEEKRDVEAKTLISISDSNEKIRKLKIGDILKVQGRLKKPDNATNPEQFDYAKYLQLKNTFSLLYVTDNWELISQTQTLKGRTIRKLNDIRNNILEKHKKNIKSPMIEILGGIIFGDDAVNPDEETKEAFMKSGILHILAASGMNVSLILTIWLFIARNLRFNHNLSTIFGILLIFGYTCMTGFGPPIIRAFLMLTFILLGRLIDRKTSTISLLFIVAFLMLIYNPLQLFDLGFQLSFVVTFGLILLTSTLEININNNFIKNIIGICIIPIIAQIFAAPLQLYYFNTFSLYSIPSNITLIPVLSIVSFGGFISSILALVPIISDKICFIADLFLNPLLIYIVKAANFFASLPNALIEFKRPSLYQIFLYFTIIISISILIKNKNKTKKYYYSLIFISTLFLLSFIPNINNQSEIIFFEVGNADSILIKSKGNKYFLIDTGKQPYLSATSQAEKIIINYLRKKGIKELEGLIITHFDSDHAGGAIDILKNLEVKNIYISNSTEDSLLYDKIKKYIQDKNLNTITINKETEIFKENDIKIKAFAGDNKILKDENEKSLIILFEKAHFKSLFMGDANTNTYNLLPENFKENINILKVGHHGAKDSLNEEIIKNCNTFIISTGINIYNHPDDSILNAIETKHKKYYRTDKYNALKIKINEKNYKLYAYSPKYKLFQKIDNF